MLAAVGPLAALVSMAAFAVETLVDVRAWRFVARGVGHDLSLGRTIAARLGLEAIAFTAPGGALTADLAGPFVLRRFTNLPLSDAVSIVLLRKWGILAGHALLLASSAVLGASFLEEASRSVRGRTDLGITLGVSAGIFALGASFAQYLLRRGPAERLGFAIARIPWYRARRLVALRAAGLVRADAATSAFLEAGDLRVLRLVSLSFALWLLESLEAFALLTLLGARPGITDVMAMEALLTVVRTVAFFLPAGLGVRELGHLALIACFPGGTPEVAAAYIVLRRALELFYALLGVGASGRNLPAAPREVPA